MSDLAPRADNRPAEAHPTRPKLLKMLPRDWRRPVGWFWAMNSHLLKDELAIATRLATYKADGLTLDELKPIFRFLSEPEEQAKYQFPGQLLAALASKVGDVLRRKKILEEQAQRREENERANADRVKVTGLLSSIGRMD